MDSLSSDMKKCPFCGEDILAVAKKCRYCHSIIVDASEDKQSASADQAGDPVKRCPYCGEYILRNAIRCEHCGSNITMNNGLSVCNKEVPARRNGAIRRKGLLVVSSIILFIMALTNPTQGDFISYLSNALGGKSRNNISGIEAVGAGFASIALNLMTERTDFIIFSVYTINTSFIRSFSNDVPENPKFIGVFGSIIPLTHQLRNNEDNKRKSNVNMTNISSADVHSDGIGKIIPEIRVYDYAGIITYDARRYIEKKIEDISDKRNIDMYLVIADDTGDANISEYSKEVIDKIRGWSVFERPLVLVVMSKKDNIVMVSLKENIFIRRDSRFLSDIINDEVVPLINEGQYDGAFIKCVDRFAEVL